MIQLLELEKKTFCYKEQSQKSPQHSCIHNHNNLYLSSCREGGSTPLKLSEKELFER